MNLLSLDRPAMEAFFLGIGEKPFRARQLLQWIYQRKVIRYGDMTDLSKSLRARLDQTTRINLPEIASHSRSHDGTVKLLLKLHDGNCIETVYIPEAGRGTLCVSSQVGCSLNCTFCATARQGFNRNLAVDEIISQVWVMNHFLENPGENGGGENRGEENEEWRVGNGELGVQNGGAVSGRYVHGQRRPVTNVVMMGMGEPLLNFDNVVSAMRLMMDDFSFGLSRRRVTLSTAGMVPMIDELKAQCPVSLAVSLHAPDNDLRDKLVPLNRKYPVEVLLECCRRYADSSSHQRITFEYVMLKGVNDSPAQAKALAGILQDVPSKVNLIPFNPFPQSQFERSDASTIDAFRDILQQKKVFTVTRKTRGDDIDAACGQLAGDFIDRTNRAKRMARQKVVFA